MDLHLMVWHDAHRGNRVWLGVIRLR